MSKPLSPATIRANVLAAIVCELRNQGSAVDPLLRRHFGYAGGFTDPYEQIPLARFVNFLEHAADVLGDPFLGLKLGAHFQTEDLGPVGIMFLASDTLQCALRQLQTYFAALQGATRMEFDALADPPVCSYQILDQRIWPRRQDAEFSLAATCSAIRSLVGPRWHPLQVHFEHDKPQLPSEVQDTVDLLLLRVFGAPVVYGQETNRLVLRRADLERQVHSARSGIAPYLEKHLQGLIRAERSTYDSCSAMVSHIISKRLGHADLEVQSIAAEIGLSARTLQRRLAQEGTSMRDLVRRHRSQIVGRLLQDRQTKMTVIAHDVGYADAATFSRAFKLWSGKAPRDHRIAKYPNPHTSPVPGVDTDA